MIIIPRSYSSRCQYCWWRWYHPSSRWLCWWWWWCDGLQLQWWHIMHQQLKGEQQHQHCSGAPGTRDSARTHSIPHHHDGFVVIFISGLEQRARYCSSSSSPSASAWIEAEAGGRRSGNTTNKIEKGAMGGRKKKAANFGGKCSSIASKFWALIFLKFARAINEHLKKSVPAFPLRE